MLPSANTDRCYLSITAPKDFESVDQQWHQTGYHPIYKIVLYNYFINALTDKNNKFLKLLQEHDPVDGWENGKVRLVLRPKTMVARLSSKLDIPTAIYPAEYNERKYKRKFIAEFNLSVKEFNELLQKDNANEIKHILKKNYAFFHVAIEKGGKWELIRSENVTNKFQMKCKLSSLFSALGLMENKVVHKENASHRFKK